MSFVSYCIYLWIDNYYLEFKKPTYKITKNYAMYVNMDKYNIDPSLGI